MTSSLIIKALARQAVELYNNNDLDAVNAIHARLSRKQQELLLDEVIHLIGPLLAQQ